MNDIIDTYERLRYDGLTPKQVKNMIQEYINRQNHYTSGWKNIKSNDETMKSLQYMDTNFFKIYVYYDDKNDTTIMHLQFKNLQDFLKVSENYLVPGNTYSIYCDQYTLSDLLDEFSHVYDEFYGQITALNKKKQNYFYENLNINNIVSDDIANSP